ncbi:MAG TPA: hypothetical protein VFZ66_21510 [Herpetosiphonaceae bacterium]
MYSTPIGEIIEANSTAFVAGTYRLLDAPPFGALVRADGQDGCAAYALVYDIHTASRELGGRAVVRGREGMYDRDIYAENPDLEVVLQTEFRALVVGFCDGPTIRQYLPPLPPPVHYSVHVCDADELRRFMTRLDFLPTVLSAHDAPADELLAAALRHAAECQEDRYQFVVNAGRQLALLLRDDHARLMTILQRIR